ncbi:hypothetical protein Q4555_06010 [Octadecabacter sp. 1_MG-2023]|uniref:hypothetical protein n=1 Tax=unclassified Octadecabacter TaxID=196158 RepID=UPI001C088FE8|nr:MULTISPECIES: hypothetical protein [unclassified Octadecabacter]MBU2994493.1 hypothetical protein [Octadecabacter sp. B2R22]MDO6734214.1 hypothetical protein [Octadecabacter sp. 1_MG-2023]
MSNKAEHRRVAVDAAYYVLFVGQEALARFPNAMKGTAFPQILKMPQITPDNENKTFVVENVPEWLGSKLRVVRHLMDDDDLCDAFVDVTVTPKSSASLPDIFMVKTPIFSAKAKVAIEAFDSDLALFYPARLSNARTGKPLNETYWVCLPKRKIFTTQKRNWDAPDYTESDGPTGKFLPALYWTHGALEYLSETFPLLEDWGGYLSMNQTLFAHLVACGLTGLTEIPANAQERVQIFGEIYDSKKEYVSHVFWNRNEQPFQ